MCLPPQVVDVRAGSVIVTFYMHALTAASAAAAVTAVHAVVAANPDLAIANLPILSFGLIGGVRCPF